MQLFYIPNLKEDLCKLSPEESRHCIKVLRLNEGDHVKIIDGKGGLYTALIVEANHKACLVKTIDKEEGIGARNYYLHVAIAPTKNIDRFEWFLEKATEIGIDEITPLLCEHSERKIIKPDRLEKIVVSAAKQSIKAYIPKLNPLISFDDFMHKNYLGTKCIAHCNNDGEKLPFKEKIARNGNNFIAIGPEGDFSPNEIRQAIQNNFTAVSLGNSRLRTETAGVVAVHTLEIFHQ